MKAKKDKENTLAKEKNSKSFYSYINGKNKVTADIGPLKIDNELIEKPEEIAVEMNNHLAKLYPPVVEVVDSKLPELVRINPLVDLINIQITEENITEALKKIKSNTAPGPDKIGDRLLVKIMKGLTPQLNKIFNKSLQSGVVPDSWKQANIKVLFKKGSKYDPKNYRGVSLTSLVGKTLERIIAKQIMEYCTTYKLVSNSQHGAIQSKSTVSNLVEYLDQIALHIDQGKTIGVLYTDYSKYFDTIQHESLLHVLGKRYGIGGCLLNWIKNWLTGRKQRVVHEKFEAPWKPVKSSVVQGSVLGVCLAILYGDGIDQVTSPAKIYKFVDDNKMAMALDTEEDEETFQEIITGVNNWTEVHNLRLNVGKCSVVKFGKREIARKFEINGVELKINSSEKDLGIVIDNQLKFHEETAKRCKKAMVIVRKQRNSIQTRCQKIWIRLYKVYMRPILEYGVPAYLPRYQGDIDKLEKIQNRVTKLVSGIGNMTPEERNRFCHLPSLEQRRTRGIAIETFKIINGMPGINTEILPLVEHQKGTRSNTNGNLKHVKAVTHS